MQKNKSRRTQQRALPKRHTKSPVKQQSTESIHENFLTPLVLAKAKKLGEWRFLFNLWCKAKRAEFLPEGIPYKISDNGGIRVKNGCFVPGLNKPLILVSDLLNKAERKNVARHELAEWQRFYKTGMDAAHDTAVKMQNRRLRESAGKKAQRFMKKSMPENN